MMNEKQYIVHSALIIREFWFNSIYIEHIYIKVLYCITELRTRFLGQRYVGSNHRLNPVHQGTGIVLVQQ